jgi:hypothetical protein
MKINNFVRVYPVLLTGILFMLMATCKKDREEEKITKEKVTGFVQKGPYINGTQILMSELNSDMEQTGNVFSSPPVSLNFQPAAIITMR